MTATHTIEVFLANPETPDDYTFVGHLVTRKDPSHQVALVFLGPEPGQGTRVGLEKADDGVSVAVIDFATFEDVFDLDEFRPVDLSLTTETF